MIEQVYAREIELGARDICTATSVCDLITDRHSHAGQCRRLTMIPIAPVAINAAPPEMRHTRRASKFRFRRYWRAVRKRVNTGAKIIAMNRWPISVAGHADAAPDTARRLKTPDDIRPRYLQDFSFFIRPLAAKCRLRIHYAVANSAASPAFLPYYH